MSMYIRVKRSKTTYFIQCEPTETILNIKEKLQNLIDQPANDQRLILVGTGDVLEDSKSLADQKVENDAVVALTLRKEFKYSTYLKNLSAYLCALHDFQDLVITVHVRLDYLKKTTSTKDDNEFEEVNIVRPNDFCQSLDGDGSKW